MFSKASLIIGLCVCSLSSGAQAYVQQRTTVAAAVSEASDREKDGLAGPVRRVTVESAKIVFKSGTAVEGPRVLRAVTTYDPRGQRIDTVAYPVEGTSLPGKEHYKYDDKGNIIEMQLRGPDGAILSKEIYRYQIDQLGNWKQMTTSVAVFQDGKLSDELVEVTYRTITYFYSEKTASLVSNSSTKQGAANPTRSGADALKILRQAVTAAPAVQSPTTTKLEPTFTSAIGDRSSSTPAIPVASAEPIANPRSSRESTNSVPEGRRIAAPSIPVLHVSEGVLRKAALFLPQPEYPEAAELARSQGKVDVEIIIDETGAVTSARGISGQPLLNEAAEVAARASRFSPTGLSQDPAKVMGIISYNFVLPVSKLAVDTSTKPSRRENTGASNNSGSVANNSGPVANTKDNGLAGAVASPAAIPEESQPASYFYKLGTSYLDSGKPAEAVQALNRAVYKDPEFGVAYVKLGLAYTALHQYKEAIAVFKMGIHIKRDILDTEAYYQMGQAYAGLGKHSEALGAFKQALYIARFEAINPDGQKSAAGPTAEELHYGLGLAYHNLGRFEDAIKELRQVIALNPKLAEAYYGLAVCYIGLGDRKSAEKQKTILEGLNPALAERISQALASNRNLPPGVNEGILGRRRF